MYKYVGKRILMIIPILFALSFIIFGIVRLSPGTPAEAILPSEASQEAIDALNKEFGYDLPFLQQYWFYIKNLILTMDMGRSWYTNVPVGQEILTRLPVTVELAFFGILGAAIIGIPIGVLSAVKQYQFVDVASVFVSMLLASVPVFWLGMILMLILSLRLGWLPSSGIGSWKYLVMPILSLALPYAAQELRYTRSSMLESIRQDFIRTARAKGAPERVVIWRHALGNALLPLITITGINFGSLIGGAVVIEALFNIPGLGLYLVKGVTLKDVPVVMGTTLTLSAIYCLTMLVIDILYAFADPRIKAQYINGSNR